MALRKPTIPEDMIAKWQRVVDLAADIARVPASLVMKTEPPDHAVLVASKGDVNPYQVGQSFELNSKLYCYAVLENRDELVVRDAFTDPDWNDNQDLEHGMSFYVGYPLAWPDGTLFGTICVLDERDNREALLYLELLQEFRRVIEGDLSLLIEVARRERAESALHETLDGLERRVAKRTGELEEANTALRVLLTNLETSRQEFEEQILRQIKGLILPHVARLRQNIGDSEPDRSHLELVEANLQKVTSSFAGKLVVAFETLTPTETEIAQMVMNGQTTKNIARALSRETSTIDFHRNNIRKKLGIDNRGVNLRSHLLSIE
ncbi:MAG: LuxR C-terminal-related transcriptional regulator [Hyphomicrobiales bacterium]